MLKRVIASASIMALLATAPAQAAVTVITFLDGTSGSHNGAFALDASSNAYALSVLCGATTTTLGATVADCAIINGSGQLTTAGTDNITQWAGSNLAAPTAPGVPQTTGLVPTVNVANTNANGQTTASGSSPVVIASDQSAVPVSPTPYPATAVPITASATGTTAATTATLTNVSGHLTYICGFSIRANATAAATGNATVTGTKTATMNFTQWTAPNASGLGVTEEVFSPCIPASAVSTSIAVVSAAPGTAGVVSVSAWGYSL